MNGTTPDREPAFTAYRQHLSVVVADALDRGQDVEARWAIITERMAQWGRQVQALVRDLETSLSPTREQARDRDHTQERHR